MTDVIEGLAKLLYHTSAGLSDEDYLMVTGKPREPWDALDEHHRDEYRFQAEAAFEFVFEDIKDNSSEKDI